MNQVLCPKLPGNLFMRRLVGNSEMLGCSSHFTLGEGCWNTSGLSSKCISLALFMLVLINL